jgi:hypothetical protein
VVVEGRGVTPKHTSCQYFVTFHSHRKVVHLQFIGANALFGMKKQGNKWYQSHG